MMKTQIGVVAAGLAAFLAAGSAMAGSISSPAIDTTHKKTKVFAGIQWNGGVRSGASLVLGVRSSKIKSDNEVHGAHVDLTFPLDGGLRLGELHVKGFKGSRDAQGELGGGYSFAAGAILATVGVQGPHVFAGTDYLYGKGWQPYIGVNTLGKYDLPAKACPAGQELGAGDLCVFSSTVD